MQTCQKKEYKSNISLFIYSLFVLLQFLIFSKRIKHFSWSWEKLVPSNDCWCTFIIFYGRKNFIWRLPSSEFDHLPSCSFKRLSSFGIQLITNEDELLQRQHLAILIYVLGSHLNVYVHIDSIHWIGFVFFI